MFELLALYLFITSALLALAYALAFERFTPLTAVLAAALAELKLELPPALAAELAELP